MRGGPPKTGIIFWRPGPLWYRLPPLGECSRNPSVSVYQLVVVWEAGFGYSEFFLKTLSVHLSISWWVIYKHTCPHCADFSAGFDQKLQHPHAPPSLFTRSFPKRHFLSSWMKKILKGKHFVDVEEVKQKTAEALKGIKINKFKNCSEQWKNILIGVLHQMESPWKVTEV